MTEEEAFRRIAQVVATKRLWEYNQAELAAKQNEMRANPRHRVDHDLSEVEQNME